MTKKNKYTRLVFFVLLFAVVGYFREFFFININNLMYKKYYPGNDVPIPAFFSFLEDKSYLTIYYLKYLFTFASFLLFYVLSYWCVKSINGNPVLLKWLTRTYLIILILSVAAMLWAYFIKVNLQDDEYTFSRWIMGIAQSPLPALFFLATARLNSRLNEK